MQTHCDVPEFWHNPLLATLSPTWTILSVMATHFATIQRFFNAIVKNFHGVQRDRVVTHTYFASSNSNYTFLRSYDFYRNDVEKERENTVWIVHIHSQDVFLKNGTTSWESMKSKQVFLGCFTKTITSISACWRLQIYHLQQHLKLNLVEDKPCRKITAL